MKKVLMSLFIIGALCCVNTAFAEETTATEQTKMEQFAEKAEAGAVKVGNTVKEQSVKAAKCTAKHAKKGAKKVGDATVREANKATRATARGVKKVGEKMQAGAEKTIEKADKKIEETAPKCKCNCECPCGPNCKCHEGAKEE